MKYNAEETKINISFIKSKKQLYESPLIKLQHIEVEDSLCNSSAGPIKFGSEGKEGVFIETWDITTGWTEKQESNFDL